MAHNEASAAALARTLSDNLSAFKNASSRTLIFAVSQEKDVAKILQPLMPLFEQVIITKYQENPRGRAVDSVLQIAKDLNRDSRTGLQVADSPTAALALARHTDPTNHVVCIAGSAFLVAELRAELMANSGINR